MHILLAAQETQFIPFITILKTIFIPIKFYMTEVEVVCFYASLMFLLIFKLDSVRWLQLVHRLLRINVLIMMWIVVV